MIKENLKQLGVVGIGVVTIGVICLISMIFYLVTHIMLPGLAPFLLAILTGSIAYRSFKNIPDDTSESMKVITLLFSIACLLNAIGGILMVISYFLEK